MRSVSGRGGKIRFDVHEHIRDSSSNSGVHYSAECGIAYSPSSTLVIGERVL
jgi:hypothetical protein